MSDAAGVVTAPAVRSLDADEMECAQIKPEDLLWRRELRALIVGPSGSGKSHVVLKILQYRTLLISGDPFKKIFWVVGEMSSVPAELKAICPDVIVERGLDFLKDVEPDSLIVFDDLVMKLYQSEAIADLAIRRSSHEKISFIIISQNLYYQSKFSRTINLSASMLICFNFFRDSSTYETLCRQLECSSYRLLHKALTSHLRERAHNFFIIDMHPRCHPLLRYRSLDFVDPEENCGVPFIHTLFLTNDAVHELQK